MIRAIINRFLPYETRLRNFRLRQFNEDLKTYLELDTSKRFPVLQDDFYPCLDDKTATTHFDAHYIYHPAWAARVVKQINPEVHVDISSTLHFCTMLSAFVKTRFYDYRPAILNLDNLESEHANLTELPFATGSIESLSCMHTLEHVGLGRYGDPIFPDGDLKAIDELKRVCATNGHLLIVVPVGKKRIQFNAHRIYAPQDIVAYMHGFTLKQFALVTDDGAFTEDAAIEHAAQQQYGCGCFWFIKNEN
ncbi:DUF268 domain-containing protein [Mucilaginibacter pedocola]|uniref:DUF268 domain-containing protein n=1 Tax=Mucilaginibacter pedocola TaxID=1792845 RepID=A0A1S9PBQ5_9SPHI|nr:DUF268 domain-containing protein [Mucilaginibacter pedocola]OOQ58359.1 hypothetical protein BC343_10425 [Mucilaginibacter pedocola]